MPVWQHFHPETTRPSNRNALLNPVGSQACLDRLAVQKGKRCDVIFIGASNVEFWGSDGAAIWKQFYAARHAFNFGVSGDRTQDVLWRLDHYDVSNLHPKVAVIMVGLNNFADTPDAIALGIYAVVKKTQECFPGVRVVVVGLPPNGQADAKMVRANEIVRSYVDNRSVFYVDLRSRLISKDGEWADMKPDRIHLTKEGYAVWAEAMEPRMQQLLPGKAYADSSR